MRRLAALGRVGARGSGPTAPVKIAFSTIAQTQARLLAAAQAAGTDVETVIAEAIYVHLHAVETRAAKRGAGTVRARTAGHGKT